MLNNVPRRMSARLAAAPPPPEDESVRLEDVLPKRPRRPKAAPGSSTRSLSRDTTRPPSTREPATSAAQPSQGKRKRPRPPSPPETDPPRRVPQSRQSHIIGGFHFHAEEEEDPSPSTPPRQPRTQSRFEPLPADVMGETPIARRNQAARRGDAPMGLGLPSSASGAAGRRRNRSSLSGKAARRVSSLRNGSIAFPHPSVPDEDLYRHCADTLDPVGRLTYLLAWCAERARPPEVHARRDHEKHFQSTVSQTLADLDSHELTLSWLARPGRREELALRREQRASSASVLLPHPRNVANKDRLSELQQTEGRVAAELQGWKETSQRVDTCQRRTALLSEALERVWPSDRADDFNSDAESEEEDSNTIETWATLEAFAKQTRTRDDEDLPELASTPGRDPTPVVDAGEEDAALRAAAGQALSWAQRDGVSIPTPCLVQAAEPSAELEARCQASQSKGKARQNEAPSPHTLAPLGDLRGAILSDAGTSRDSRWAEVESQVRYDPCFSHRYILVLQLTLRDST